MNPKWIKMALVAAALTGQLDAANLNNEQISSLQKDVKVLSENILWKKDARSLTTKELSRLGLNISSDKMVSYDFGKNETSDDWEDEPYDGPTVLVQWKKSDTSKLEYYADSWMIKTDAVELSKSQWHAIDFLKKEFPEYANDAEMINLLAGGEEEWVWNGQKLSKYYGYVKKFASKKMIWLRIKNTKKYAPNLYKKLYDNEYPLFKELNVIITLDKDIKQWRNDVKQWRNDVKQWRELLNALGID